ncbi:hypothetical protein SmJEL517_g04924 [Synchytrium microbalum]|uniref:Pre-rRNA-processing protein PNO1 n=1 Tax=Synchytrium microbalum TaxID=1806994 RepID=A0A507BYE2_9FUNG|nr:uncharacterized protein SmJEL517_g04924 [Synchytrium microbalum]TPX31879.1 hypothetical protein SmJEL517_g04924 [Synchytrium microbalum]
MSGQADQTEEHIISADDILVKLPHPQQDAEMQGVEEDKPNFPALKPQDLMSGKKETRRVLIPPHRLTPLKKNWMQIYTPLVENMKLQVRMNLKARAVELRTCPETEETGALQKGADFVKAFSLGFEIDDALALLRLDDIYIDTFEIKDVKTLHGDHLSRAIGRIVGKDGKTRFAIENASRTRIVVADSKIHILGSFGNIKIARDAVVNLILGASPGKVYSHLRIVGARMKEKVYSVPELAPFIKTTGVSIELPGTKENGFSGIYRSALLPNKLVHGWSDCKTIYEAFESGCAKAGKDAPCLGHKERQVSNGVVTWTGYVYQSWAEVGRRRLEFGAGLQEIRASIVKADVNDKWPVGIYAINRPEWYITDHAVHAYSNMTVALFDTLGPDSVTYIINHANLSVVVCSIERVPNLLAVASRCPSLKCIVSMDSLTNPGVIPQPGSLLKQWAAEKGITLLGFGEVEALGRAHPHPLRKPAPEDIATLCYTSGTTGNPSKVRGDFIRRRRMGAIVTHDNFISSAHALQIIGIDFSAGQRYISYLPLAHIYDRNNLVGATRGGCVIGFSRGDVALLFADIAEFKPHIFASVPRLLNRLHAAIMNATVNSNSKVTSTLFKMALDAKTANLNNHGTLTHSLWDRLVFAKVKNLLGGNVKLITSGSAPISGEVLTFLRVVFSCEVVEGWGATETAASGTVNLQTDYTSGGKIGAIIPCSEIRLADIPEMKYTSTDKPFPRGEILIRGPNVFQGYYKDVEKTKEALVDGWYYTGDVGAIDEKGRLQIVDRRKHIFKLAQGEYVAPEKLENIFLQSDYIMQCFVWGDSLQNCLVAVIVPEAETSMKLAMEKGWLPKGTPIPALGVQSDGYVALSRDARYKQLVLADMQKLAKKYKLSGFEIPKDVFVTPEMMSIDNGLLTPTLKVMRNVAAEKFRPHIDEMYGKINASAKVEDLGKL